MRQDGGRGLVELESGLSNYITLGKEMFMQLVRDHDAGKAKYSLQKETQKIKGKYLKQITVKNIKMQLKNNIEKKLLKGKPCTDNSFETWKDQPLHLCS